MLKRLCTSSTTRCTLSTSLHRCQGSPLKDYLLPPTYGASRLATPPPPGLLRAGTICDARGRPVVEVVLPARAQSILRGSYWASSLFLPSSLPPGASIRPPASRPFLTVSNLVGSARLPPSHRRTRARRALTRPSRRLWVWPFTLSPELCRDSVVGGYFDDRPPDCPRSRRRLPVKTLVASKLGL